MGVKGWAALWGIAEATLFFIVPDVLLTRVAMDDLWRALRASLFATGGALAGGMLMYAWGVYDVTGVRTVLDWVPGISPEMTARVAEQMSRHGAWAMFIGPITGTPYKLYAAQAAGAGIGPLVFALVSIPARLLRFVLLSTVAAGLTRTLRPRLPRRVLLWTWAGVWTAFYAAYFLLLA